METNSMPSAESRFGGCKPTDGAYGFKSRVIGHLKTRYGQIAAGLSASLIVGASPFAISHPLVVLAVCLLPIAALVVLAAPLIMGLLFVTFSFFRIHEAIPQLYSLKIPQLLALATLAGLFWHLAARRLQPFWSRELTLFFAFFFIATISVVFATARENAMGMWSGTYIKVAIMVLVICWITRTPKDFALATRLFVGAGILIAVIAISNKMNGIGLVEGTRVTIGRDIGSQIGDPNDLALVLLFPASFALSLLLTRGMSPMSRIFGGIAFVVVVWGIIATQSRGGLLGIVAVCGVFGVRTIKSKAVLAMIAAVGLMGLFAMAGINDRQSGGAAESGIDESAMGRIYAWGAAWKMAITHPLTGVGMDSFNNNYFFYSSHWDGKNHAVHSTWFQIMAETGFIGFLIFVSLIGRVGLTAWNSVKRAWSGDLPDFWSDGEKTAIRGMSMALLAGLAGISVSCTFLTMGYTWPLYMLLALTVALARTLATAGTANAA